MLEDLDVSALKQEVKNGTPLLSSVLATAEPKKLGPTTSGSDDIFTLGNTTLSLQQDIDQRKKSDSCNFNLEMHMYSNQNKYPVTPVSLSKDTDLPNQMFGFTLQRSRAGSKPENFKKKLLVYYTPSMKSIGMRLKEIGENSIQLGNIRWSHFNDEFPNLRIKDADKIRYHHVAFLASLSSPTVLFEQYAVMAAIPKHLAKSVILFIPYFAVGTMERVTKYGEIATAETLSRMLSAIPNCARGPCQIVIFDIHALQNQFYFSDNVLVRLETAIPLLHQAIRRKYNNLDNVAIAFPDEGAFKRFHVFFEGPVYSSSETIICTKRREGKNREVKVKEGNPKDRDVVIVDDLVQTGGTLVNCARVCLSLGARSVSCYCTHGVFPRNSWKRFISGEKDEGLFDTFWITNSIPPVAKCIEKIKPFEVLDLSPLYWNILSERL